MAMMDCGCLTEAVTIVRPAHIHIIEAKQVLVLATCGYSLEILSGINSTLFVWHRNLIMTHERRT